MKHDEHGIGIVKILYEIQYTAGDYQYGVCFEKLGLDWIHRVSESELRADNERENRSS